MDNSNNQGIVQRAYGNKNRGGFIARKRKGAGRLAYKSSSIFFTSAKRER